MNKLTFAKIRQVDSLNDIAQTPWIIAHRGASGDAPENTLSAFRLAVEQGCHAIELDVRMSRDGHLVVCHDATVDRTTNGKGAIHRLTLHELQRLDAGGWFAPNYAGEGIPALEQVFQLLPAHIWVNIEVKHHYRGRIEEPLIRMLRQYERVNGAVISSFDPLCLVRLKRKEPALRAGLLFSSMWRRNQARLLLMRTELFSLHPKHHLVETKPILQLIGEGFPVFPYTINKEQEMHAALERGVAGIITDYPARLRQVLKQNLNLG